jgi:hypothetical protein
MAKLAGTRSPLRYWALVLLAFVAAFVVALPVAYVAVWIMGGRMGEIEGAGKYVAIIVSLVCGAAAYSVVLRQAFRFRPNK